MEMVINGYALNMSSETAIAPRQSFFGSLLQRITGAAIPSHVLAATKISLEEE